MLVSGKQYVVLVGFSVRKHQLLGRHFVEQSISMVHDEVQVSVSERGYGIPEIVYLCIYVGKTALDEFVDAKACNPFLIVILVSREPVVVSCYAVEYHLLSVLVQ